MTGPVPPKKAGERWVALAEVARPHGVRGELRLKVYNADSDLLLDQSEVMLRGKAGSERMFRVEQARSANEALLVKLAGIDDRDEVEPLRGAEVCVKRDAFPPLEPGEFYVCDVLGARVVDGGGDVGVVDDMVSYPSTEVLVVRTDHGERIDVPLVEAFVESVDADAGRVVLAPGAMELLRG